MKNIDKNSQNKGQDDNTLIYILLLLLVAILVGTIAYLAWPKDKTEQQTYDYEEELGVFEVAPTAKQVSQLISGNRSRLKTAKWVLQDKIRNKKLTAKEKEEVRKELEKIDEGLDKTIQGIYLEKQSAEMLAIIYSQLYEQGKVLTRIKSKIASNRTYEELWKQWKVEQPNWKITATEQADIEEKMNGWITTWYNQAMTNETKLTEFIEPRYINGRKIDKFNPSPADVAHFREKILEWKNKDGTFGSLDLRNPPFELKFLGYAGFLTLKDLENTEEGKEIYGLTISTPTVKVSGEKGSPERESVNINVKNRRWIKIKLKRELFFNRLGHEEWINRVEKTKKGVSWGYNDICFEQVVETIVHELAHAVISSTKGNYRGQEGGGHGQLFYDYMKKIEKMVRETPEFAAFAKWWDKTKE